MNLKLLLSLPLLLSAAVEARGQSAGSIGDSIVYRDTLIERPFQIMHKPLRGGFEPMYGKAWYSGINDSLPEPMVQHGCDNFTNGSGNIYGLRFLAQIPTWGDNSQWTIEPSIYAKLNTTTFDWNQVAFGFAQASNNTPLIGSLTTYPIIHELTTRMWEVGIEGRLCYDVTSTFALHAGPSVSFAFGQTYERWIHLSAGNTVGGVQDEMVSSGPITRKYTIIPAISLAASYELPLSQKLRAQPSIEMNFPFLGITPYWTGYQVIGGVSFLFDLTPRREVVPIFEKRQVPVVVQRKIDTAEAPLTASIRALAVSRNGDTSSVVRMTVEEVRTRNAYPVLNYIFFEEGLSKFPGRYVQYASPEEADRQFKGSVERADTKLMDLYRETLNVLGDRLRKYPSASVMLIGSTSNVGRERNDIALARSRAQAVKDYLVHVWKIEPHRIHIEASLLPERPSPLTTEAGQAENRRVEFRVADESVVEPVIVTNIEHLATPDRITLKPHIETHAGIMRTFASISAGGVELQSFPSNASSSSAEKLWAPTEETLGKLRDSLRIDYEVWDSAGHHAHASSSLPLDVTRIATDRQSERVERFSLILFGFDESRVEKRNEREIRKAAEMIPKIPVERILIQGFTDETGDIAHNDALSQERAEGVRKRLEEMLAQENAAMPGDSHTEGRGSRDLLYDNRLPEGRFFSRTVNIIIQRAAK